MPAPAPSQHDLFRAARTCPRCGRELSRVVLPDGALDLLELVHLPEEEFRRAVECWLGNCGGHP